VSCVGHVSGDEQYECVVLRDPINVVYGVRGTWFSEVEVHYMAQFEDNLFNHRGRCA
jgi:hypothetical protein